MRFPYFVSWEHTSDIKLFTREIAKCFLCGVILHSDVFLILPQTFPQVLAGYAICWMSLPPSLACPGKIKASSFFSKCLPLIPVAI